MTEDNKDAAKFASILNYAPSGKTTDHHMCGLCTRLIMEASHTFDTPYVKGVRDDLCPSCREAAKETAPLVCVKGKHVVSRFPYGDASNILKGFQITPGMVLHTKECPECSGRTDGFMYIAEMVKFCNERKILFDKDIDKRMKKLDK